jgi:hypothetical protein
MGPLAGSLTEKQVIGILRNTTNPVSPSSRAAAFFPFFVVFFPIFSYVPLLFFCTVLPIQTHPRAGSDRLRAEGRYSRDGGYGAGGQLWRTHRARPRFLLVRSCATSWPRARDQGFLRGEDSQNCECWVYDLLLGETTPPSPPLLGRLRRGEKGKRAGCRMRGGSAETSCWIPVRTNAERSTGESDWRRALLAGRLPRRMQPR